jgi:hypothetical protein
MPYAEKKRRFKSRFVPFGLAKMITLLAYSFSRRHPDVPGGSIFCPN